MQKGKFIVLEGIDGAGTTTQARLIQEALQKGGLKAVLTAQPSIGPIGKMIRSILRGEVTRADNTPIGAAAIAALFAADRSEHLDTQIQPWLDQGYHVICDRYYHSSLAYQGLQLGIEYVAQLNAIMKTPDLIFFIDVDPDIAHDRRLERNLASEMYEEDTFQQQLRLAYRQAFQCRDRDLMIELDGNDSIETINAQIMEHIHASID